MVAKKITQDEAVDLFAALRNHFVRFQDTLQEIIERKAWEPLGFASFAEAWTNSMADLTLARELRPHVVYTMFAEGLTADDVSGVVKGLGPAGAKSLKDDFDLGKPVELASERKTPTPADKAKWHNKPKDGITVREHTRKQAKPAGTLHLELGAARLKRYERAAKANGATVAELALEFVDQGFKGLGA